MKKLLIILSLAGCFNTYGQYSIGNGYGFVKGGVSAVTLPISLLYFKAVKADDKRVDLLWSTASEINNSFFTIEKTKDGISFETVAIIPGAGSSKEILKYSVSDNKPYAGVSYYRLKQTDFDGKQRSFPLATVDFDSKTERITLIKADRESGVLFIKFSGYDQKVTSSVLDATGRELVNEKHEAGDGVYSINLGTDIPPGVYMLKTITSSGEERVQKFIY